MAYFVLTGQTVGFDDFIYGLVTLGKCDFVTSFIFKARNIPAALYKALGGFATNGINMIKIESYLESGTFVSAQFYVEVESHPSRKSFQNAFDELKFFSESVHVLGTYVKK